MLAKDIMTKEVITVSYDMTLHTVGTVLMQNQISGVPVLDESKRLTGIITLTDLFRILSRLYKKMDLGKFTHVSHLKNIFKEKLLIEFMTSKVYSVKADTDLSEIVTIMLEHNIHTIPVVDNNMFVIGIIGKHDIDKVFFG